MIRLLVHKDHELLRTNLFEVEHDLKDHDLPKLFLDMKESMVHYGGVGLAANQIGVALPAFVFGVENIEFCYKPRITMFSDDQILLDEACLTYPGLQVKIKRPVSIRLVYQNENLETKSLMLTGLSARIVQHEMTHLQGRRFFDDANRYHKAKAFAKLKG